MSDLIKLSVSKSSTFNSCKAKYKFAYIHKLPRKEWEFHLFGRFAHRVLELFHLKYINGSKESLSKEMSNSFNESLLEFKGKISNEQKEEAYIVINNYLQQLLKNKQDIHRIIAVEKTFNLEINSSLILTGMIDRVQKDDDGIYHVIDYKTSKSKNYLKDDTLQLLTYAYVLLQEYSDIKKVRVSYIMLKHNSEYLTKEFNLDEILSVKDIYEKYAQDIISEQEFKPNPSKLCEYCDYLHLCDSGLTTVGKKFSYGKTKW